MSEKKLQFNNSINKKSVARYGWLKTVHCSVQKEPYSI